MSLRLSYVDKIQCFHIEKTLSSISKENASGDFLRVGIQLRGIYILTSSYSTIPSTPKHKM